MEELEERYYLKQIQIILFDAVVIACNKVHEG